MPFLSVVIPTYNRCVSLKVTLNALKAQEAVPGGFEVVVVSDGSTDGTDALLAGWMALAGLLIHGVCLGGFFIAMSTTLPLGLVALIGSLQPVLTAIASRIFLDERLRTPQWLGGDALGIAGGWGGR